MVEYSKLNVKLSYTQLKKLKTAVKDKTGATLRMNLKILDGNDLPHELLLTTRQKAKLINALNNNMSTDLKLSKAKISKLIKSGGFLGSLLSKLPGPLMKVAIPLAKNVLASLGITAAASAIDAKMNELHNKIVQALEYSNILLKGVTKTNKNEIKEQKGRFLSILLGTLGASFLGNLLAGKRIVRAGSGKK